MLAVPIHFIKACLCGIKSEEDLNKLLAEADITRAQFESDDAEVSPDQYVSIIQATWLHLNDEFLGLTAQPCKLGFFSIVANACGQQATLGEAYREWVKIYTIAREDSQITMEEDGDIVRIGFTLKRPELDAMHFLTEVSLITLHRFGSWLTGVPIPLEGVCFDYEQPPHAHFYPYLYPATPRFEEPLSGIEVSSHYMNLPLIRNNREIQQAVRNAPASFMDLPEDLSYSNKVAKLMISEHKEGGRFPNLEEIANSMHVNQRTLRRKLQNENSSYQRVKDLVRKELAIDKLQTETINLEGLAFELGFTTQQSFSRAFKRWTQLTPREYLAKKEHVKIHGMQLSQPQEKFWAS